MCFYYTENKTTTKISIKHDNDNDNKHPVRRSKSKNYFVWELKLDNILN